MINVNKLSRNTWYLAKVYSHYVAFKYLNRGSIYIYDITSDLSKLYLLENGEIICEINEEEA